MKPLRALLADREAGGRCSSAEHVAADVLADRLDERAGGQRAADEVVGLDVRGQDARVGEVAVDADDVDAGVLGLLSGGIIASGSVREIMIASGSSPISALTIADCLATSNSGAPWYVKSMPSSSAAGLGAARDGVVERVAGQARHVDDRMSSGTSPMSNGVSSAVAAAVVPGRQSCRRCRRRGVVGGTVVPPRSAGDAEGTADTRPTASSGPRSNVTWWFLLY